MKPCYMLRKEELAKHAELCRRKGEPDTGTGALPIFEMLAGGDLDVFAAMWAFWNFEHAWDDLLDETGLLASHREAAMESLHEAVCQCLTGPALANIEAKTVLPTGFRNGWKWLLDKTGWSKERKILAATARNEFFAVLLSNPFVRRHAPEIRGMLVMCMVRCLDGDEMAASDKPERRLLAPAVRCGDVDLMLHLVYLARGWAAVRALSGLRDYDLPDERPARKEAA